jgi:UPF0755 protein
MMKLPRFGQYTIIVVTFLLIVLMLFKVRFIYNQVLGVPVHHQQKIYLPPHSSAKSLVAFLKQKKITTYPRILLLLIKQHGYDKRLRSGTYLLEDKDSTWDLVEKIVRGQVYKVPFKIIEGTRLCELTASMQKSHQYTFSMEELDKLPKNFNSLEGLLYPSTYFQAYGEDILPVLKLSYQLMQDKLNQTWNTRDLDLPYRSSYDLLIAASIIEKESADIQERKLISGVIVNRLRLGMPLQMDPTVAYALPGCSHTKLTGNDLKFDSKYNTYLHKGLPPTPISVVSMSSLQAAAHPTRTTFLYFVAKGDGHHVFSTEYNQQKKAINQYLRMKHVE